MSINTDIWELQILGKKRQIVTFFYILSNSTLSVLFWRRLGSVIVKADADIAC